MNPGALGPRPPFGSCDWLDARGRWHREVWWTDAHGDVHERVLSRWDLTARRLLSRLRVRPS